MSAQHHFENAGLEQITRHRCRTPSPCDRRRKIGKRHRCQCGTTYVLAHGRFGREWLPLTPAKMGPPVDLGRRRSKGNDGD